MPIRYFVDASMKGVGMALERVREDVTYAGAPDCPIKPSTLDPDWLPIVGERGWVVLTRDKHFRTRPGERLAFVEHRVRAVTLTRAGNLTQWEMLQLLVRWWDRIEDATGGEGPILLALTTHGLRGLTIRGPLQ